MGRAGSAELRATGGRDAGAMALFGLGITTREVEETNCGLLVYSMSVCTVNLRWLVIVQCR
jgi:hypothetical protein